ncbi:MAG: hypothetical protein DBX55_00620 [Verrucomicrobia bacterium]|nr:MAG: hypothetical protein DBX55_00620 [Verrucomicrobiota bacterium]
MRCADSAFSRGRNIVLALRFFAVAVRNSRVLRAVLNVCLRAGILCAVAENFKRRFPVRARFAAGGCRVFYGEFFNAFFGFYIELIAGGL